MVIIYLLTQPGPRNELSDIVFSLAISPDPIKALALCDWIWTQVMEIMPHESVGGSVAFVCRTLALGQCIGYCTSEMYYVH